MGFHHYKPDQRGDSGNRQMKHSSVITDRRKWYVRPSFLIKGGIAFLIILYSVFGDDGIVQSLVLRERITKSQAICDSLSLHNKDLQLQITALQNNEESAIEREARKLGMIKNGEKLYLIVAQDDDVMP